MVTRDLVPGIEQRFAPAKAIDRPGTLEETPSGVARTRMLTNLLGMLILIVLISAFLASGA